MEIYVAVTRIQSLLAVNKTQYENIISFSFFLKLSSDVGHLVKFYCPLPSPVLHMTLDE